jgi:sec-independent protein translocase protein TatB
MFDVGWTEIAFVGALALVVVGPRDLPQFIHGAGRAMARVRRVYRDSLASLHQLEREIQVASAPPPQNQGEPDYYALLPDHVLEMLRSGQAEPLRDAAAHEAREREIATALADARAAHEQTAPRTDATPPA